MNNFEKLEVYVKSLRLVDTLYTIVAFFPDHQKYSLTQQITRAAISVPSNIAEGSERQHPKEFIQFLYISKGSCAELVAQLTIARNRRFLNKEKYDNLLQEIRSIMMMLNAFIRSLRQTAYGNR